MLTLDKYLAEIRADKTAGWSRVFKDILGQPLSISDRERFIKAVDSYGDSIIFEALVITSVKRIAVTPINYVLAVAASKWKEELLSQVRADQETSKANLSIEQSKKDNQHLYKRIEEAKRRVHGTSDTI
jgi:hypothetical protein